MHSLPVPFMKPSLDVLQVFVKQWLRESSRAPLPRFLVHHRKFLPNQYCIVVRRAQPRCYCTSPTNNLILALIKRAGSRTRRDPRPDFCEHGRAVLARMVGRQIQPNQDSNRCPAPSRTDVPICPTSASSFSPLSAVMWLCRIRRTRMGTMPNKNVGL